jgi:hypothetical protein
VFDTETQQARVKLLDTTRKPYEAALVVLGQLIGTVPSEGDSDSASDVVWIFGNTRGASASIAAFPASSPAAPHRDAC